MWTSSTVVENLWQGNVIFGLLLDSRWLLPPFGTLGVAPVGRSMWMWRRPHVVIKLMSILVIPLTLHHLIRIGVSVKLAAIF
jgi:hypothetical protein